MKSRRVSIAICAAVAAVGSIATFSVHPPNAEAEARGAGSTNEEHPQPAETPPPLEASIIAAAKANKVLAQLDRYRPVAANKVRFLVIVDRIVDARTVNGRRSPRIEPDLLATRDGRLWLLLGRVVRPLRGRDLSHYGFSIAEVRAGLKSAARRPISLVFDRGAVLKH